MRRPGPGAVGALYLAVSTVVVEWLLVKWHEAHPDVRPTPDFLTMFFRRHKGLILTFLAVLAAHIVEWLPHRFDPFSRLCDLLRRPPS